MQPEESSIRGRDQEGEEVVADGDGRWSWWWESGPGCFV